MAWKKKNSLACITLSSCMQGDLLIESKVYQTAHEMWKAQALNEKYGGLSTTKLREFLMKFGNYKMQSNHTLKQHLREMKKMIKELKTSKHVLTDEQDSHKIFTKELGTHGGEHDI